jgi:hypothetical protein
MGKTPIKRSRKGTNLYLPAELVKWATEYAGYKHGWSLSQMVERQLLKLQRNQAGASK